MTRTRATGRSLFPGPTARATNRRDRFSRPAAPGRAGHGVTGSQANVAGRTTRTPSRDSLVLPSLAFASAPAVTVTLTRAGYYMTRTQASRPAE
jgi:hypothetical protein